MQMVGATKSFIRKPFIWRSIKLGFIASVLAVLALIGVLFYIDSSFPSLGILDQQLMIALVLLGVLALGILLSWFSTFFATQRYLNLRTDDLY
jgi:cell division transport system permease protein